MVPLLFLATQHHDSQFARLLLHKAIDPKFSCKGRKYKVYYDDEKIGHMRRIFLELGLGETELKSTQTDYIMVQLADSA
jgi:hypothetical protein